MRGRRSIDLFGISLLRKQVSPCLLGGSLAYIFSGFLINAQFVKNGAFAPKFLRYRGEKGSETFIMLTLSGK